MESQLPPIPYTEADVEIGRARCRRSFKYARFSLLLTLVLLGIVTFFNPLLERILPDDPRVLVITFTMWTLIITAWLAAGYGWFGRRLLRDLEEVEGLTEEDIEDAESDRRRGTLGCVISLLPCILLAVHYKIHGPREPAPEVFAELRKSGLELATNAGSPPAGSFPDSTAWLASIDRADEEWCVVEGLDASDPPQSTLLISPNLRWEGDNIAKLLEVEGVVQYTLDPKHPLGSRWVVVVRKDGSSRTFDAHQNVWKNIILGPKKGRILHPKRAKN